MHKVVINQKILDSLGLSQNERRVFDALTAYPLPNNVQTITEKCGLARMTVFDILRRLEKRNLVEKVTVPWRKKKWWKYKRGLEFIDRNKQTVLPVIGEVT